MNLHHMGRDDCSVNVPRVLTGFLVLFLRLQLTKMEIVILNQLEFCLTAATVRDFVGIYLRVAQADKAVCMLVDVCCCL